ncbi:MAG TPA: methylated-DNA--[protein]-cysteine S-methyltransferase [bacterium]|nr:methylated-DNA--[protein]-cysteine S-methyltransferase [bacterium]
MAKQLFYSLYAWEPANLLLVASEQGLFRIEFVRPGEEDRFLTALPPTVHLVKDERAFDKVRPQLDVYFSGKPVDWQMALDVSSGTDFQQLVWSALRRIPYGQTITYGQLAQSIGKPGASRAVGAANAANPLPVIIPCHRVVAGNGRLGGFSGGLHIKQALLRLEGALL